MSTPRDEVLSLEEASRDAMRRDLLEAPDRREWSERTMEVKRAFRMVLERYPEVTKARCDELFGLPGSRR